MKLCCPSFCFAGSSVLLVGLLESCIPDTRLPPLQSGNRRHHSTETLNLYITDRILEAMDRKELTALFLLDLSKAFDSVCHTILLQKLRYVGVSPDSVRWFKSYLCDKTQYTRIGPAVSSLLSITHGVPQGTILSPLLFGIYLYDLPMASQASSLDSYVDDSKVFPSFAIKDMEQATQNLEEDLSRVANWCFSHQLLINPAKTKFILLGTRKLIKKLPSEMSINFLGEIIRPMTSAKDLGVLVDSHLTFDFHIAEVVSSCMWKLCQTNRVNKCFNQETLLLIISALVINFCTARRYGPTQVQKY